jgi:signal transduction histidine kinase
MDALTAPLTQRLSRSLREGAGRAFGVFPASAFWRWPILADLVRALVLLVLTLGGMGVALDLGWYPMVFANYVVVAVLCAVAVLLCRLLPVTGLVVVGLVTIWPGWYFEAPELRLIPVAIAAFLASSNGLRLRVAAPLVAVPVVVTSLSLTVVWSWGASAAASYLSYYDPSTRILTAIVAVGALLLGNAVGLQRRSVATLRQRNAELERLREADAARIAAQERTALARELHDVVAHHVSAMVIRAQAADRVADSRPDELRDTVRWIAGSGQEALTAMRQVVRVLRADGATPPPTSADFDAALHDVVTRVRDTGLAVRESVTLDGPLPAVQAGAVLRILQESLTNVLLHSDATEVQVGVRTVDGWIEVRVDDDGTGQPGAEPGSGGGSGLPGMRERAEAVGGSLDAGRFGRAGWSVRALLPVSG